MQKCGALGTRRPVRLLGIRPSERSAICALSQRDWFCQRPRALWPAQRTALRSFTQIRDACAFSNAAMSRISKSNKIISSARTSKQEEQRFRFLTFCDFFNHFTSFLVLFRLKHTHKHTILSLTLHHQAWRATSIVSS